MPALGHHQNDFYLLLDKKTKKIHFMISNVLKDFQKRYEGMKIWCLAAK